MITTKLLYAALVLGFCKGFVAGFCVCWALELAVRMWFAARMGGLSRSRPAEPSGLRGMTDLDDGGES